MAPAAKPIRGLIRGGCLVVLLGWSGGAVAQDGVQPDQMSDRAAEFRRVIATLEKEARAASDRLDALRAEIATAQTTLRQIRTPPPAVPAEQQSARDAVADGPAQQSALTQDIARQAQISDTLARDIASQRAALEALKADRRAIVGQVATLRGRIAKAEADQAMRNTQAEARAKATLSALNDRIASREDDLAARTQELAALQSRVDRVRRIADRIAPVQEVAPVGAPAPQVALLRVATAVRNAPGLQAADPAQRAELERLLNEDTCAYDALSTVFGRVERQTLVSLIRDLGSC